MPSTQYSEQNEWSHALNDQSVLYIHPSKDDIDITKFGLFSLYPTPRVRKLIS